LDLLGLSAGKKSGVEHYMMEKEKTEKKHQNGDKIDG